MSLEELWHLFPIFLTEPNKLWLNYYNEMHSLLEKILAGYKIRINHIGSSAIKNIWAKPIIDILVEIEPQENMKAIANIIKRDGFLCMSENSNRMSFNYGYTECGFAQKVYHLHLRFLGDNDELYFRDYLNDNPQIAKQYEKLKLELWRKYEYNRDAYTDAKKNFVRKYTDLAKKIYPNRY